MVLNAFCMNTVSHLQHGLWVRPDSRQREFNRLDPWLDLARLLERGGFDTIFLADVAGISDVHGGGPDAALRHAVQLPVNDPAMLIPAMATATEHLGFAFTSSVLQTPPFTFARQATTLDHLTGGRIAWNIVTSHLASTARNLGFDALVPHDERYERAEEYLEVVAKLWEGSWEDGAVLADLDTQVYADPARVHAIDHHGRFYDVAGPFVCEPSPQRTPVLFQAGASERGREFAAKHAEGVFVVASRRNLPALRADIAARAVRYGRRPADLLFCQGLTPVVGGTEAEAHAKADEYRAQLSFEGGVVQMSGMVGVDLSDIDPDRPIDELRTDAIQSILNGVQRAGPAGTQTFADLVRAAMTGQFAVGTPEQLADLLESWQHAGADGFNIMHSVLPASFVDFVDGVVPVLRARGLVRDHYEPGPLRQKLFGAARLPDRHPDAAFRVRRAPLA